MKKIINWYGSYVFYRTTKFIKKFRYSIFPPVTSDLLILRHSPQNEKENTQGAILHGFMSISIIFEKHKLPGLSSYEKYNNFLNFSIATPNFDSKH